MAFETPKNALSIGPTSIPDHQLLKLVGRGSYGEVWLARNVMGTYRAIKIVYRDAFEHERPYQREYEGIRKFEPISRTHDSQVDVLHVGQDDQSFYYVMELADDSSHPAGSSGDLDVERYSPKTLKSEMLLRGPLAVDECVEIGLALSTALAHLHKNQLVHRDIKPSNIIYLNGLPKLADIGLVCAFDATISYVGTIGFVAPEGPGTPQADIYSLGKVLYEAATARDRQDFPELPTQISGTLEQQRALLELNEVLLRSCEGNPNDRYQSADEMQEDLLLLRSGESLVRLRTAEKRFNLARRLGIAALLAAFLGGLAYWNQARQTRVLGKLVQEKTELADEKSRLATEKALLLNENREHLARLNVANGIQALDRHEPARALLWFAEALPLVTNRPADEARHRIRIQQTLNQQPRLLQVLPHDGNVGCAAFSPDGQSIATLSGQEELRIWDAATGALKLGPLKQPKPVYSMSFSHDGQRLLLRSCTDQNNRFVEPPSGHVSLLNAATGRPLLEIKGIGRAALSPDERWLATVGTNNVIHLIDLATSKVAAELSGNSKSIFELVFDNTSALLASGGEDKTVRVWRVPSGESLGDPITLSDPVERVIFSPDSSTIATGASSPWGEESIGYVRTWRVTDLREIGAAVSFAVGKSVRQSLFFDSFPGNRIFLGGPKGGVSVLARDTHKSLLPADRIDIQVRSWDFSPDGRFVAIGSDMGVAALWDVETGARVTPQMLHTGWVESVQFNSDGTRLLTASDDGTVKVWDLTGSADSIVRLSMDTPMAQFAPDLFPYTYALSADTKHLLIGGAQGRVIDTSALRLESNPVASHEALFLGVAVDANGEQWAEGLGPVNATPGKFHDVTLWRREKSGVRIFTLKHPESADYLHFTKDGSQLLTMSRDYRLRRWRTRDGTLVDDRPIIKGAQGNLATFSPDDRTIALWGQWSKVLIYDSLGTQEPYELAQARVLHVAFSPDGLRFATVGGDQKGHIWEVSTGRELCPPFKHGGTLFWVEWSPDGKLLLTAGLSPEIQIWNSADGTFRERMQVGTGSALIAHFSPDGRFVVGRNTEQGARAWDVSTGELVVPEIGHEGILRAAFMLHGDRLMTISDPGVIRAVDLIASPLPSSFLERYARLLAGQKLTPSGRAQALAPAELTEGLTELRLLNTNLFRQSATDVRRFHRAHVFPPLTLLQLASASFHLEKLAESDPGNSELPTLRQMLDFYRIPPRESGIDEAMIDLSSFYNASLTMSWADEFLGHDLRGLPRGRQTLDNILFDIRGMIQISPGQDAPSPSPFLFPSRVFGMGVHQKAKQLHFLHASQGDIVPDGEEVGRYIVRYGNGSLEEIKLRYGEDLRDWFSEPGEAEGRSATRASVAWTGKNTTSIFLGRSLRLFHLAWKNPHPADEIATIDFVAANSRANPFLVALTAESLAEQ